MRRFRRVCICMIAVVLVLPVMLMAEIDPDIFAGLKARSIGPANMSGRIGSIDAVHADPNIIYVGSATGGLWKSADGGITWNPLMDDKPVSSFGAVAINQSNPNIVWAGTGEATPRNSVGVGRGVYLTIDAGKTWKFLGLEKTEKICKILLDPDNPNVAYVGASGTTWGESPERGVYKTVDMGKTWEKILFVDEKTGAADMAMDPGNPNKILVGMWQHQRWPWFFESGGPGSGLYITTDGGETWEKQSDKNGLPKGDLGRIGIAFSTNMPEIVYAIVEAEKSVLLRSSDGGSNWVTVNQESTVGTRPFYYHRIWVNPVNENIVYMLHSRMMISEDAGKTFSNFTGYNQAHADFHAMWIHPDGNRMVVGNDGGVVITHNRGKNWRFVENLPLGQYYHVSYDMELPYNLYGGLQDNGSWRGPGWILTERAIYNYHWITVGGGDGFDTEPDPENSKAGYGMSQGGNLYYFDISLGTSRGIVPTESDVKHRYNWNAGFAVDPFDPATIYLGSQFVHKSPDKGQTWEIISPDLTTNDPEKQKQAESGGLTLDVTNAENHCTILCIAPSPLEKGVIWVSTDDGNVQLTRDGGESWELVSGKLTTGKKGMPPPATWCPHVEASKHDAATAYAVFDDHRRSNWTSYAFVTHDYGKSWKSLVTPDIDGFVHVIEEDVASKDLLFIGTEFGLFVSFDAGGSWMKWTHGVPIVPVRDITVHPRENDLIIATHGRSLFIIDDISPLREFSEDIVQKKLHLFDVPDAYQYVSGRMSSHQSPGDTPFAGENKRTGACITYYLIPSEKKPEETEEEPLDDAAQARMARMRQMGGMMGRFGGMGMSRGSSRVTVTVQDGKGRTVSTINGTENKGINRVYWSFREDPPQTGERERGQRAAAQARQQFRGFRMRSYLTALPGEYTVKIKYDEEEVTSQPFTVKTDPRLDVDIEILKANYEEAKRVQKLSQAFQTVNTQIQDTEKALQTVTEYAHANRSPGTRGLIRAAGELEKKLKTFSERLNPTPAKQGIADRSAGLSRRVSSAVMGISRSGIYPVSQAAQVQYEKVKVEAEAFLEELNAFYEKDVEEFKKMVEESGFSLFKPFKALKIDKDE